MNNVDEKNKKVELQPSPPPPTVVKQTLVEESSPEVVAKVISSTSSNTSSNANNTVSISEFNLLKKSVQGLSQKLLFNGMGGGGTGVVRFLDLDDHQHPEDIRYLRFNMFGPIEDPPDGSICWNPEKECVDIHQTDGTTLQVGLEQYIRVINNTGNTLNAGTMGKNANDVKTNSGLIPAAL